MIPFLKPVWAFLSSRAGLIAIVVLLALCVVQTVRLEGFKLWPVHIRGYIERAETAEADLARVKVASDEALAKALAAKLAAEQKYIAIAKGIDDNAKADLQTGLNDADRFIAANRVRYKAVGCPTSGTVATPNDNPAASAVGAGATPVMDDPALVAVPESDIRICTINTIKAEAGHELAKALQRGI